MAGREVEDPPMRLLTAFPIPLAICLVSTTAAADVIHGCVKSSGTLKVVSGPGDCDNNATAHDCRECQ